MTNNIRALIYKVLIFAGYISFFFHSTLDNPLVIISVLFLIFFVFFDLRYKHSNLRLLLPLSSGILCFVMRLFYWDRFDFLIRVNNLLLLSLVFSLFLIGKKFNTFKKCLYIFNRYNLKKRLIIIFIFCEIVFIFSSYIIVKKKVILVGDEPHYLAVSQSIAKDFDLNVFNQYYRDGYREFIDVKKLPAHAVFGVGYKKMYSYHLPGVSVTLLPFFFLKLPLPIFYFLVRSYMGIFGALLAVLIYLFSLKLWRNLSLSFFITSILMLTVPVFFSSVHIFPEIQALLLILSSLYLLLFSSKSYPKVLIAGLLLGITVFWGLKYNILIYLFCLGFFIYFILKKSYKRAFLFVLFPIIFHLLFFYYLYYAYGSFSPNSIYYGIMTKDQAKDLYHSLFNEVPIKQRIETFLDYFFDQRDGILLYNPFYFFMFPGLLMALRKYKKYLLHILISIPGFVYIIYHAFSTIRAGFCPQGRYLVPVVWLLMLFSVIYYKENRNWISKKILLCIPLYAMFVVIYQLFNPFTLYQTTTHDHLFRPGLLFQQWSNLNISLPQLLPSFIKVANNEKYIPNIVFLVLFLVLIVLSFVKIKKYRLNLFFPVFFVLFFILFSLFPKIPLYNPTLVEKNETIPYIIYGENDYPTKKQIRIFKLTSTGLYKYTASTLKRARNFILEFESGKKSKPCVNIFNFDQFVKREILQPKKIEKILIKNPQFKKIKNRFYYQFNIKVRNPGSRDVAINFQLYPKKNI